MVVLMFLGEWWWAFLLCAMICMWQTSRAARQNMHALGEWVVSDFGSVPKVKGNVGLWAAAGALSWICFVIGLVACLAGFWTTRP
jgi:hypothetical protein